MIRHGLQGIVFRVLATATLLLLPFAAHAQEATLTGTITDTTGGVLPGVTITAFHEESGNTFVGVTDTAGVFRLPVRIGPYRVTAELQGFATVTRTGLQMQVGQLVELTLQMAPSTVQETVTVTGEAPLIEVTTSAASTNIDQRQMQELPLNGRNWLDLTLLAPGSRANTGGETPIPRSQVAFQINMDGQQVTNSVAGSGFGQPRFSRDSIAEFEFITNKFDATQGRSMGVVVNAVTKSGSNRHSGTMSGYFRDSDWSADDPVENRVIPFSNQQYSATYGGPIRRDRIHFFANYEYEREPQTAVYNSTLYPAFNTDLQGTRTQSTAGVKVDTQFTPQMRLSSRVQRVHAVRAAQGRRRRHEPSLRRVAVVAHLHAVLEPVHAGALQQQGQRAQGRASTSTTGTSPAWRRGRAVRRRPIPAASTRSTATTRRRTARCSVAA